MATLDKVFKDASVKKVNFFACWKVHRPQVHLAPTLKLHHAAIRPCAPSRVLRFLSPLPQLFKDLLILAQYVGRRVRTTHIPPLTAFK
jgi:hypothetical protein